MTRPVHTTTRIIFADDHQIVREGLARLIDKEKDLKIIAEADNGIEAARLFFELKPNLIILDLRMPQKDGATAAKEILSSNPAAKIMILTSYATAAEIKDALHAGVTSAIVKDCSCDILIDAIRRTARGEKIISPEIADTLKTQNSAPNLSSRQKEVLHLVSKGFNNDEIAERLGITRHSVKAHLAIAFERLGASSRTEAATIALTMGLI